MIYVTIEGVKYAFKFGWRAIGEFCDKKGIALKDFKESFTDLQVNALIDMIEAGFIQGARKSGKDLPENFDGGDFMDAMSDKDMAKIMKAITSMGGQKKAKATKA